jgi:protein SSD1
MLLANIAVAHKITSAYPDSAMLRRHQPPLEKSLLEAIRKLEKNGITIDTSSSKSINDSLNNISDPTRQLISRLILIKSMKRADYYCSGAVDASTFPHFALSVPLYTHFTSPIRRYCDLIVHRLLEASMKGSETPYEVDQISIIAKICNQRNFAASDAQDQSDDLFLCLYLHSIQSKPEHSDGIHAKGYVMDVGTRSYDVFIPEFGLEKRVWIEDLIDDNIRGVQSDTDNLTLKIVWNKGEQIVTMYDHVNVVITTDITKSPPMVKVLAQSPFESLTD